MFLAVVSWSVFGLVNADVPESSRVVNVANRKATSRRISSHHYNLGSRSCAASACHGSIKADETNDDLIRRDEYLIWQKSDPHETSFRTLSSKLGLEMFHRLGVTDVSGRALPDKEDEYLAQYNNCLNCHATKIGSRERSYVMEGVSCESCHGSASEWRVTHYQESFSELSDHEKSSTGYRNLQDHDLVAQRCVSCHIGSDQANVNHDLIAAGHPALRFELTAYLDQYPKHWKHRGESHKTDGAEAWFTGQTVSATAALQQLLRRANTDSEHHAVWPELSEFNCYACHHQLSGDSWRMTTTFGSSSLKGNEWYVFGLYTIALQRKQTGDERAAMFCQKMDSLNEILGRGWSSDQQSLEASVREALGALERWLKSIDKSEFTAEFLIAAWSEAVSEDHGVLLESWDRATQAYLALYALNEESNDGDGAKILDNLESMRELLSFPNEGSRQLNSPRDFHGELKSNSPEDNSNSTNREKIRSLMNSILKALNSKHEG